MLSKTHILAGIVVALGLIQFFPIPNAAIFFLVFVIATVLPDVDTAKSKVGRKMWPLSTILEIIFGHRGFLHSIWIPLAIFLAFWYYGFFYIGLAAMGGYVLHLFVDALTLGGIRFFGFGKKRRGFFKTGGLAELGIFILLLLALVWLILNFF